MYLVIEIQKAKNGAVATIVTQHQSINEADAKYHTILGAAAISAVPVHAAVILGETGNLIRSEHYKHGEEEDHFFE